VVPGAPPSADASAPSFFELDRNHDGRITSEEAQANPAVAQRFAAADLDGDGTIEPGEFQNAFVARQ
jgi:Ca2+-binding EF-hand superfamily protein